jgi:hypothetical protein
MMSDRGNTVLLSARPEARRSLKSGLPRIGVSVRVARHPDRALESSHQAGFTLVP